MSAKVCHFAKEYPTKNHHLELDTG